MKYPSKAKLEALDRLVEEAIALYYRLRTVEEEAHPDARVTPGMRGVMAGLEGRGPQTVPQLALARDVSRQHVQVLVNRLLRDELAELVDNPAHQRSRLVQLTALGQQTLLEMRKREEDLLSRMPVPVSKKELRGATATLRAVRELFESDDWSRLVRH